mmetsp:Transcript_3221/g.6621  ORF Transcript_3221/g.6621 Transcript_3221/m.6621 type:complete len:542 (-) Transcript_3221:60-1685(-)
MHMKDSVESLQKCSVYEPLTPCSCRLFRVAARYNDRLKEVMRDVLLISELAAWARRKRDQRKTFKTRSLEKAGKEKRKSSTNESSQVSAHAQVVNAKDTSAVSSGTAAYSGHGSHSSPADFTDYSEFLMQWDEPERRGRRYGQNGDVSGKEIIEFRSALTAVTKPFFFSSSYGPVETREECMKSGELLFRRLVKLMDQPENEDSIDVHNLALWLYKGCSRPSQQQSAADLMDLLLPDQEGCVSLAAFLTGIDSVYRKIRLLESSVENHSHVDKSYEKVINIAFGVVLFCVAIAIFGIDPLVFIASLSAILVSFAFMIGAAASQQFEGILLVLVRQPYDIGDIVAINQVDQSASIDGSEPWEVLSIDLVTTTARYLPTNEVATFSNGSLARCRIINLHRSPEAMVHIHVRFAVDVPYEKILKFKASVEKYVEDRPQEWVGILLFRTVMIQAQQNYVEYTFVVKHQSIWQDIGTILVSRGQISSFMVEIQKQLGCYYEAPPVGVEVNMMDAAAKRAKKDAHVQADPPLQDLLDFSDEFAKKTQ